MLYRFLHQENLIPLSIHTKTNLLHEDKKMICNRQIKSNYKEKIPLLIALILLTGSFISAKTIQLDRDGDGTVIRNTLPSALLSTVASAGDTILIVGTDIDTFDGTLTSSHQTNVIVMGSTSNPDSFPVFKDMVWRNWWETGNGSITFKHIKFSNCNPIYLGATTCKQVIIDACIFSDYTNQKVFDFTSDPRQDNFLTASNSIFFNTGPEIFPFINKTISSANGPYGLVNNCTFDSVNVLSADNYYSLPSDTANKKYIVFSNSIFYRVKVLRTIPNSAYSRFYTNCLLSPQDTLSYYGANCFASSDPVFVNKNNPGSGHQLRSNSPAINKAGSNSTTIDLGGRARFTPDIGAFEYVGPPQNISLTATSIAENLPVNTTIGSVSVQDSGDAGPHALVLGGPDSAAFAISGTNLVSNRIFNYESKSSFSITIKATDRNNLSYTKTFTITITNVNDPPTNITLSKSSFPENAAIGTDVGIFRTVDEDAGSAFTYSFVTGGADNASFTITDSTLKTATVADYETKKSYIINVKTSDGTAEFSRLCTLTVENVNEPHTGITLSDSLILEKKPVGTFIGKLSIIDIDIPPTPAGFALVSGTGSTDNGSFSVHNDSLFSAAMFDYATKFSYSIRIRGTDTTGYNIEKSFSIIVGAVPKITAEPVSKSVGVNKNTSFTVTATGPGTLSYKWYRTGTAGEQGTAAQLVLANVPQTLDQSTYSCIVANAFGSVTSALCTLTVIPLPVITSQPKDTLAAEKKTVSFSIAATGFNLRYLWVHNGKDTLPLTTNTLTLSNIAPSDSGDSIWCIVSNDAGDVKSATARLYVARLPHIATHPADVTVQEGDSAKFSVTATGTPPLTYQWIRNGVANGTQSPQLVIFPVTIADSNVQFACIVSNAYSSDTSGKATLKVLRSKPIITTQPLTIALTENDTGFMYLDAIGTPPLSYEWYKVGLAAPIQRSDTLFFYSPSKSLDSGSRYYCVVSNGQGSTVSDTATLLVGLFAPRITKQPQDTLTVYTGSNASVSVDAFGSKPLSFTWKKSGDTSFTVTGRFLSIDTAIFADSGFYYCQVKNGFGVVISDTIHIRVVAPPAIPIIITQPKSLLVTIGDSATFTIDATGNPSPSYQWYWKGAAVVNATTKTLVLKNNADSLSSISCVVYNTIDTISSDTVTLKVILKPTAQFTASPLTGPESTTVVFTNKTTGPVQSYFWSFGDGKTSTEPNPSHQYTTAGLYSVTLRAIKDSLFDTIVKTDLISIYPKSGNPVIITAQYLTGRNIAITFSNLNSVDITPPVPFADSMGLWIASGKKPSIEGAAFIVYPKSVFSSSQGVFRDTIPLPGQDTLFGLRCGIYYNDKQLISSDSLNTALVLLKDTLAPFNPLTAQATYLGKDSVRFTMYHLDDIDTNITDSIFIVYSMDSTLKVGITTVAFSLKDFNGKVQEGSYSTLLQNSTFATENARFYFTLSTKSKNGKITTSQISSFYTAGSSDVNPIILQSNILSPSSVQLYWRKISDPAVTEMRIFYSSNEISVNMVYPKFPMDTLKPRMGDTILIVSSLNSNTTYYFGAQVRKRNTDNTYTWSPVTLQSLQKITTPPPSAADTVKNSITILEGTFTNTSQISLNWCITDSLVKLSDVEVGITYSTDKSPVLPQDPQVILPDGNCSFSIVRLRQSILFDTTYYIAMWMRLKNGPWAEPTENSRDTIKIGKFTQQTVYLFNEGVDTCRINNASILFWKDKIHAYDNMTIDTVRGFKSSVELPGMVAAGQGIEFVKHEPIIPFFVGLRYSCPAPFTDKDVRLYRYINGSLAIERSCEIDELNKIIYFTISDLTNPIIPLIDTLRPVLTIHTDTSKPWDANTPYTDSVTITDNILNPKVLHFFCSGDLVVSTPNLEEYMPLTTTKKVLKIPATVVTTTAGVRSSITITDSRNSFTVNTSRRVKRTQSDEGVVQKMQWHPLAVTADLDNTKPQQLFSQFMKTDSTKYDILQMRMFRWFPNAKNKSTPDYKWIQYSDSTAVSFGFQPGILVWVKTKEPHAYHFGAGTTLSLKDTFKIALPPKEWSDIGLPFKFSSSISDIISISPGAENLQFTEWVADTNGRYSTSDMYAKGLQTKKYIMSKDNVFAIYNPTDSIITLRVPPIPAEFSAKSITLKTAAKSDWWIRLRTRLNNNTEIPDVYCGTSSDIKQTRKYPSSPTFCLSKVKIFERETNQTYGHFVQSASSSNEGIAREVMFDNQDDSAVAFNYSLEKVGSVPENYGASLYNPVTQEWLTSGTVTVGAHSSEYRWMVSGTDNFKATFLRTSASFKFRLYPAYPNPARSFAILRYSIPLSAKEKIVFTIYDALGRAMWQKRISEALVAGDHNLIWDGTNLAGQKVSSGMYIVVLSVLDTKGAVKYRFDSRLTYFQ
jgi:PKD repeat protein